MVHPRAKLTVFGRQLVVRRVLVFRWSPAQVAAATGVSRATVYKWVGRFKQHGDAGLADRSSRPIHCRQALAPSQVARILAARRRWKHGPHRLAPRLGLARSTIYGVLRRHQLSRLRDADRSTAIPIRYVRERAGELLHLDTKKLGRIPAGGGHRMLGRPGHPTSRQGYDYLHVAVDDATRFAFVEVHPDESDRTVASFMLAAAAALAERGVRVERVLTDRGNGYRSRAFADSIDRLRASHKFTRPYRPQTNGKAERFIKTLLEEWAYARFYPNNRRRLQALPGWIRFYNRRRPHTALKGLTPAVALVNNVGGNHT
jgi:transposase InsO family protein